MIDADGNFLLDTPYQEIRTLGVFDDRALSSSSPPAAGEQQRRTVDANRCHAAVDGRFWRGAPRSPLSRLHRRSPPSSSTRQPPHRATRQHAGVLRLPVRGGDLPHRAGRPLGRIWDSREDLPYDVAFDQQNRLIVATGDKGKIYRPRATPSGRCCWPARRPRRSPRSIATVAVASIRHGEPGKVSACRLIALRAAPTKVTCAMPRGVVVGRHQLAQRNGWQREDQKFHAYGNTETPDDMECVVCNVPRRARMIVSPESQAPAVAGCAVGAPATVPHSRLFDGLPAA